MLITLKKESMLENRGEYYAEIVESNTSKNPGRCSTSAPPQDSFLRALQTWVGQAFGIEPNQTMVSYGNEKTGYSVGAGFH